MLNDSNSEEPITFSVYRILRICRKGNLATSNPLRSAISLNFLSISSLKEASARFGSALNNIERVGWGVRGDGSGGASGGRVATGIVPMADL